MLRTASYANMRAIDSTVNPVHRKVSEDSSKEKNRIPEPVREALGLITEMTNFLNFSKEEKDLIFGELSKEIETINPNVTPAILKRTVCIFGNALCQTICIKRSQKQLAATLNLMNESLLVKGRISMQDQHEFREKVDLNCTPSPKLPSKRVFQEIKKFADDSDGEFEAVPVYKEHSHL
jgi:hypothetical protein